MRILMLSPNPAARGAIPRHTPHLVDGLRALGCDVTLEPWGRHRDEESVVEKLTTRSRDIRTFRRRLSAEPFDLMVVKTSHESLSLLGSVPLLAVTRRLVPTIVVQFHGGRSDLLSVPGHRAFKAASAALFAMSDGVFVLSSEEARDCRRFWPRGRFRVVSNPFVRPAENGSLPRSASDADKELSLLFVGRLIKEKGIFEMLSAFESLAESRDCRLVIAGDGPAGPEIERRVEQDGLRDKVTLTGYLSGKPLFDLYRAADVFVFPSYREGFPTAVTEAMAAGLPVVTTRTRGMADHLHEEENALLVEPGDASSLADALQRLVEDRGLRARMSVANKAKVGDFAPDVVARQYLDALSEIIEHQSRRRVV